MTEKTYLKKGSTGDFSFALLWNVRGDSLKIRRFFIASKPEEVESRVEESGIVCLPGKEASVESTVKALKEYFRGSEVSDALLDTSGLSAFEQKILGILKKKVKRGSAISYGALANLAGHPGAARAVGTVMSGNPFPLFFPCHRVLRSGGEPGNFGPGTELKRLLLAREGLLFDSRGRVLKKFMPYD